MQTTLKPHLIREGLFTGLWQAVLWLSINSGNADAFARFAQQAFGVQFCVSSGDRSHFHSCETFLANTKKERTMACARTARKRQQADLSPVR